jgi:hypothetical protein
MANTLYSTAHQVVDADRWGQYVTESSLSEGRASRVEAGDGQLARLIEGDGGGR